MFTPFGTGSLNVRRIKLHVVVMKHTRYDIFGRFIAWPPFPQNSTREATLAGRDKGRAERIFRYFFIVPPGDVASPFF
jgi:hypothetical protein